MRRTALPDRVALEEIELAVRVNRRARRISLKVDAALAAPVLVLPSPRALAEGLRFAESRAHWLKDALARLPSRVAFADGATIPYRGEPHLLRHRPDSRGGVWRQACEIHVTGRPEHLARRLTDWLKREARQALADRVALLAAELGRPAGPIGIRDPRSRWGSCAADGALSFSWRLVLAPAAVLNYVAAHEVAHLVEANHGPAFWALVARLDPDHEAARHWLRRHGAGLHRYG